MTIAEQRALEAYPHLERPTFDDIYPRLLFTRNTERSAFVKGYEQAEKDTIERAIAWLKENANKYIVDLTPTYPDAPVNIIVGGMCWEHLKQELEER